MRKIPNINTHIFKHPNLPWSVGGFNPLSVISANGGWYNFRELTAGADFISLLDKMGNYTATPTTNAPSIESKFGVNALRFDKANSEGVNLGTDMQQLYDFNSFSILFTISAVDDTANTNEYITGFSNASGVSTQIYRSNTGAIGRINFNVDNGSNSFANFTDFKALGLTNFHTVIITFDAIPNSPTIWVDGIKVPQTTAANTEEFNTVTTGFNWFLGIRNNNGSEDLPMDGWMTDFIWTEGIWTDTEISELTNYYN